MREIKGLRGTFMRGALYLRVSTTDQGTGRQEAELRAVAAARGYQVVQVYTDQGISLTPLRWC
jgi:DNA invertase Pin-like site-specific DNA recombinase